MATRPNDVPEWASVDSTEITAPTTLIREEGWDPAELPQAQHDNWKSNLTYLWILWFLQSVDGGLGLIFPDQATELGAPPAVSLGLTRTSGDFTGSAIIGGNLIAPTESPAVVYPATQRHYWDLGLDGVWDLTSTSLAAAAPAVAADHERVYVLTTDGTGIDSVTLAPPARARLGGGLTLSTAQMAAGSRLIDLPGPFNGTYTVLVGGGFSELILGAVFAGQASFGGGFGIVTNATFNETSGLWVRDNPAEPAVLNIFSGTVGMTVLVATVAGAGADWPDTISGASWVQTSYIDPSAGHAYFAGTITAAAYGNVVATRVTTSPLVGAPIPGTTYRGNTLIAWGTISSDGAGDMKIDDGFGVGAVTLIGGNTVQVELRNALANTLFAPVATYQLNGVTTPRFCACGNRAASGGATFGGATFRVQEFDFAGGATPLVLSAGAAGSHAFSFHLYGAPI